MGMGCLASQLLSTSICSLSLPSDFHPLIYCCESTGHTRETECIGSCVAQFPSKPKAALLCRDCLSEAFLETTQVRSCVNALSGFFCLSFLHFMNVFWNRRCWRRSRSLPQGKEIMKRRAALGRKDKSNSIIIIFSWASLSDEKHAVSLDLVPWISQKSWGRNCFREHLWASISLPEGSWSAGTEALHLSVELST